jgi:hypothetical protein
MSGWSPSVPGLSGALANGDWFWLLDGRNLEWLVAAALCLALTVRAASLALKR